MYISDSGLLHALLDIETKQALLRHPKIGASWEGFMLESVIQRLAVRRDQCFFWATHTGAELALSTRWFRGADLGIGIALGWALPGSSEFPTTTCRGHQEQENSEREKRELPMRKPGQVG